MHHIGNTRLNRQLERFTEGFAQGPARLDLDHRASAHDMLVMSSRPDLTPEFPAGLRHPTQSDREPTPSDLRP
jgi:hypothetical protein